MGTRLVLAFATAAVAGGLLAGGAASAGPPAMFGTVALKPLPKPGKADFFVITVKGKLASGVKSPNLYLSITNPSVLKGNLVAAAEEAKPTTAAGKTTAKFYVAIDNSVIKKTVRLGATARQGDALDLIVGGANGEWGGAPTVTSAELPCKGQGLKTVVNLKPYWTQFWAPNSSKKLSAGAIIGVAALVAGC